MGQTNEGWARSAKLPISPSLRFTSNDDLLRTLNAEIVLHGKDPRHPISRHIRKLTIALGGYDSIKSHVPCIHDYMYRRISAHCVPIQAARSENRTVGAEPDRVVRCEQRQHFYVVGYVLDSGKLGYPVFSIALC